MRVCFYTLGCKVNLNETGALEQLFRANGFTIAQEGEAADVFIVNSCLRCGRWAWCSGCLWLRAWGRRVWACTS